MLAGLPSPPRHRGRRSQHPAVSRGCNHPGRHQQHQGLNHPLHRGSITRHTTTCKAANPHNQTHISRGSLTPHVTEAASAKAGADTVNQCGTDNQTHISRIASTPCHGSNHGLGAGTHQDNHSSNVAPLRLGDSNRLDSAKTKVSANPLPPCTPLNRLNPASSLCHGGNSSPKSQLLKAMGMGLKS